MLERVTGSPERIIKKFLTTPTRRRYVTGMMNKRTTRRKTRVRYFKHDEATDVTLCQLARAEERPVSDLIRRAVREFVERSSAPIKSKRESA